ncbi:hypothetical protein ACFC2A_07105 [Enterobacter hormaechei]
MLWQKAIRWHIPLSFLVTLALCATLGWLFSQKHWQHANSSAVWCDHARRILYFD